MNANIPFLIFTASVFASSCSADEGLDSNNSSGSAPYSLNATVESNPANAFADKAQQVTIEPVEPSPLDKWSTPGVRIAQAEAIERFDLKRRLQSYGRAVSGSKCNTQLMDSRLLLADS
ncbi:hypothetical protein [Halopseudomonas salegens]|uniref:Uncharacterized protein n=1 Tax=Halopseudomonas salegens TaxID=1434072 RepID=A0A1H2G8J0_9GAMM|nr:hypothetical protein [Halopseudomonas salegens]SDU15781.1 hypothetical protein SAMN05216210_2111 [Halopseudomonas salegens]